jgi:hypothetical protein
LKPLALIIALLAVAGHGRVDAQSAPDRAKVLRAAADALGMVRWSDIGTTTTRLPGIDVVNTMEFHGSGTVEIAGRPAKADYRAAIGYNPPGMRVELTWSGADGRQQRAIQTVRDDYAWDDSEIGAGLIPGKGTATPAMTVIRERLLQLWTLPYGVVKAAIAAGDRTTVASQGGVTTLTFPLSGMLSGITVSATLDSTNLVTKVDTRPGSAAPASLATQTDYSNYADRAEVLTDIKTPGRIVRRQGTRTVLDVNVMVWETNNPYLVFPVPANVKGAAANR